MKCKVLFIVMSMIACFMQASAQYTVNGNATQDNCHCYTLTQAINTQGGSVWNNNKINLNQSFDFTFQVFLGCTDGNGADGIAFVLQPISASVGTSGGGMGFQGVNPSVGVTLDTYQNSSPDNDPFYDHIAIQLNGNINHSSASTLTPLTAISATNNNVEDCQNHTLRIVWDAITKNMTVYFDGQLRVSATNDFVNNVFGGDSMVYWGFTGATGGLNNLQKFCTTLTPSFHFPVAQNRCVNEPVTFIDSTVSFAGLLKRYWNFGDGSPIDSVNVNPVHIYTAAGIYNVTLRVIGIDGCEETFTQLVYIGSKPVAGFSYTASCVLNNVQFTDTSDVAFGTINSWYWNLDNAGITSTIQNPSTVYTTAGIKTIKFVVKTQEGCVSDTLRLPITVSDRSIVNFTFTDSVCLGTPTSFFDQSTVGGSNTAVNYWQWTYSDSSYPAVVQNPRHIFTAPGNHTVTLVTSGSGNSNCAGTSVTKTVFVADKPIAAMKAVVICERQSIQLQDSSYSLDGLAIASCWWDLGNGQFSNQCNPTVTYNTPGPKIIKHVVYNARGCKSDTLVITINVADKPLVRFGFSAPICNDSSIQFRDSSIVGAGNINQWNWIYNNATFSSAQNPTGYFPFGNVQVGLSVTSNLGCFSDTVYKPFRLIRNPRVEMQFNDTCKFSPVRFTANETAAPIGITTWQWYFGDSQTGLGMPTTHTYTSNGQYTVTLYVTSIEGCKDTVVNRINIYGTDAFAGEDVIAAAGQPIQLQATGGISYEWIAPNDGLSATNIPNPIATNTTDREYILKAFTPGGCESYDTIQITIYKGPEVYFPNAFTPNGDGLNETVKPFLVGVTKFNYYAIYNRYGQKLFYSPSPNKPWDGRFRGQKQPIGTYIWIAEGMYYNNKTNVPSVWKGTVMIVR
jgi:hypothetical protein